MGLWRSGHPLLSPSLCELLADGEGWPKLRIQEGLNSFSTTLETAKLSHVAGNHFFSFLFFLNCPVVLGIRGPVR